MDCCRAQGPEYKAFTFYTGPLTRTTEFAKSHNLVIITSPQ